MYSVCMETTEKTKVEPDGFMQACKDAFENEEWSGWPYADQIDEQLRASILQSVTDRVLATMQKDGWYDETHKRRTDRPTLRDMNNGFCELWVKLAQAELGGKICWLHHYLRDEEYGNCWHCVLHLDDLFFDSEHPHGTAAAEEIADDWLNTCYWQIALK